MGMDGPGSVRLRNQGSGVRGFVLGIGGVTSKGLVCSKDLVNPATELSDTGVDGRSGGGATAASPGHDTDQSPGAIFLADQRTTRIALKDNKSISRKEEKSKV